MLLRMSRGLSTQNPPWKNLTHEGRCYAACSAIPTPTPTPNTCRLGLAPGPGGYSATGLGPAQQPLRSGDFLHLRNKKRTQQPFCIQHSSPAHPRPRHCTACLGASPPHCPLLLSVSPQPPPSTVAIVCLP
ncbi:unnamed protein product [Pipistrellus nathusii]|uniref:Uncharacterized protein n=1 Tax=Pipistrellus nathusii TaxID=59473 RepID=A0ABN9ZMD5_PIPNA